MSRALAFALLVTAASLLLAACGEEEKPATAATATVGVGTQPPLETPAATIAPGGVTLSTPRPADVTFGREAVEQPAQEGVQSAQLAKVQTGEFDDSDRVIFQFANGLPGYRIEYVAGPVTACASGETIQIDGRALLQVRFSPAAAHDEAGAPTIEATEQKPALPALLELEQTCDFEGVVIWVLGLAAQADFRVLPVGSAFVVVDVRHP